MSTTNISFQMPPGFEAMQPVVDKLLRDVMAAIDTKADQGVSDAGDAQDSANNAQDTADEANTKADLSLVSVASLAQMTADELKELKFLGEAWS